MKKIVLSLISCVLFCSVSVILAPKQKRKRVKTHRNMLAKPSSKPQTNKPKNELGLLTDISLVQKQLQELKGKVEKELQSCRGKSLSPYQDDSGVDVSGRTSSLSDLSDDSLNNSPNDLGHLEDLGYIIEEDWKRYNNEQAIEAVSSGHLEDYLESLSPEEQALNTDEDLAVTQEEMDEHLYWMKKQENAKDEFDQLLKEQMDTL